MIPKTNYFLLFFVLICCFSTTNVYAQCNEKFTDPGGLDMDYLPNADTTYTFCPDVAGDVVTVTFTFVDLETTTGTGVQDGCYDFLSIYSGSDTSTPLQSTACGELDGDGGVPSVATSLLQAGDFFISNSADGCLTFTFSSDGSVQEGGWVADVTCAPPPACSAPTGLSASNITQDAADLAWASMETSFDIEWGPAGFAPGTGTTVSGVSNPYTLSGLAASTAYDYYVCALCDDGAGGTITSDCTGPQSFATTDAPPACGGFFIDSGGLDGAYDASANESVTICPDMAGDVVTITFTFVDLETSTGAGVQGGCFDFLSIYSGSDTSTPLQTTACGELDGDGSVPSDATSLLQAGDFFTSQSADGCLTITFSSDGSVQQDGWAADITCAPPADCPPPASLTVSNIGGSSAELSWTSTETTFNIEYDTTGFTPGMGTMVNGVTNPYTLTGLTPETSYEYYVCAVCDDGAGGTIVSNCTGPQTFTTDVACPAPTDLATANETETSADLSWTSVETSFDIEWGPVGFAPGSGTVVNGISNPYTLSGLTSGTAYEYYVCALCDDGMGGTISSECTGPFAFATGVPAPTCSSGIFFDNGGPAAAYAASSSDSLTICPDVAGDVVTVTFTFVDLETGGSNGGCWDFLSVYDGSSTADTLQAFACGELDGDGSTPTDATSLLQAGDFFISTAADGCLTFTFNSDGSVQEQGWEATITCGPPSDCPQPSTLTASNIGGSSADLSWTSDETSFDIEWGPTGFTPGSGTTVNGITNPYTLTGLSAETTYDYYVCAICDDGMGGTTTSNCTGPQSFTTDVACPAPTDLAAANETETSVDLSWTSTETTFNIEYDTIGFTPGMGTMVNGVSNPYTLTGLDAATAYEYYVCAVCDDGMGGTIASTCTGPFSFATTVPAPTCTNGVFIDNGGSGLYPASSSDSIVICPDMMGDVVTVTFTFVDIETTTGAGNQDGCWDFLSIYNGSGTLDTLQMTACGELDGDGGTPSVPESLLQAGDSFTSTAADGCLTFTFNSDGSVQEEGWEATVTCAPSTGGVSGCTDPCATNYDPAATMDDGSCVLPEEPATACYETATFNTTTCVWDITGDMPAEPSTACYETATFNDVTCVWDVTGDQPAEPATACYETATFNDVTCVWDVTGDMPAEPSTACYETATFNDITCVWDITGDMPAEPSTACYETATFNDVTCVWDVTGDMPAEPSTACYETATFNDATCAWDVTGDMPAEPTTECYETAAFNDATCVWDVTGDMPAEPSTACYETATFNDATCAWDVTGDMPTIDDGCEFTDDSFDDVNCVAVNTSNCPSNTSLTVDCLCEEDVIEGCTDPCATNYNADANSDDGSCVLPAEPATECYETATFNTTTCQWDVSGDQPAEPALECYETATFNTTTCAWEASGEQPAEPTTECYETATFNDVTCVWDVIGDMPTVDDGCDVTDDSFDDVNCVAVNTPNCPDGTTYDSVNCACTTDPVSGCTDPCASNYNPDANSDDGSCVLPAEPTTECYETATFNTTTCVWDVTGEMPAEPAIACYETTTFDDALCAWVVVGEQPNIDDGCDLTDDSFDNVNCVVVNTPNCPVGADYNPGNCECMSMQSGCTDPCASNYDPNAVTDDGSCILPAEPTTACYETATFNTTACVWEVTGDMPAIDDGCDVTDDSFDDVNCVVVNTPNCPANTMYVADSCECMPDPVPGCTNPAACDYNAAANIDDGTCTLPGDVCNDGNPLTINDTVQADCSCEGIDSGEAIPTVGEWGLIILALILLNLGVLYIRQTEVRIEKA